MIWDSNTRSGTVEVRFNRPIIAQTLTGPITLDRGFELVKEQATDGFDSTVKFYSTYVENPALTLAPHYFDASSIGTRLNITLNYGDETTWTAAAPIRSHPAGATPITIGGIAVTSGKFYWPFTSSLDVDGLNVNFETFNVNEAALVAPLSSLQTATAVELDLPEPPLVRGMRDSYVVEIASVELGPPQNIAVSFPSAPAFQHFNAYELASVGGVAEARGDVVNKISVTYNWTTNTWSAVTPTTEEIKRQVFF